MKALFALFAFLCLATSAQAQDDPPVDCNNAMTQMDMNICAAREFAQSDSMLNVVYKQVMGFLDASIQEAGGATTEGGLYYKRIKDTIVSSQRAWIALRDNNASIPAQIYYMGSIAPLMVSTAKTADTKARTKFLEDLLKELRGE